MKPLRELSEGYLLAASPVRNRLRALRQQLRLADDPAARAELRHQLSALSAILTQLRELAELTAHYYERGYHRNEKYTL